MPTKNKLSSYKLERICFNFGKIIKKWKLKHKTQPKQIKPILCDTDNKSYLEALHRRYSVVTIDKVANNFAFMCEKNYISKLLGEVCLSNLKFKTYSKAHRGNNSSKYRLL